MITITKEEILEKEPKSSGYGEVAAARIISLGLLALAQSIQEIAKAVEYHAVCVDRRNN